MAAKVAAWTMKNPPFKSHSAIGEASTASAPFSSSIPTKCPGCHGSRFSAPWVVPGQPAVLNYRCHTEESAKRIPLQELHLVECGDCGLIFNAAFDERLVPYDEGYDNCQSFSSVFSKHLEDCANHLATTYPAPASSMVLEPGCGKGAYLKLLCAITGWRGVGYDTTCEIATVDAQEQVRFFQHYVNRDEIREPVHAIVCRHVIEHVSDVRAFLRLLHDLASAGGAKVIYLETPTWEWIVNAGAFWDIFHEHCNYFTMSALRRLCEEAGFRVLEHFTTFSGQYQSLYLSIQGSPARRGTTPPCSGGLEAFAQASDAAREHLRQRLAEKGVGDVPYGIWGAGAKGVTLANTLSHLGRPPAAIIDCNPGKTGTFTPGVGTPVHAPSPDVLKQLPVILVPNPIYRSEIESTLNSMGLNPTLIPV
jgi:hypothetical protein